MSALMEQHEAWKPRKERLWGKQGRAHVRKESTPRIVPPVAPDDDLLAHVTSRKAKLIIIETADKYRVGVEQIVGESRAHQVVLARQEACYRMRHEVVLGGKPMGLLVIAAAIRRDHTAVIWAIKQHEKRLAQKAAA